MFSLDQSLSKLITYNRRLLYSNIADKTDVKKSTFCFLTTRFSHCPYELQQKNDVLLLDYLPFYTDVSSHSELRTQFLMVSIFFFRLHRLYYINYLHCGDIQHDFLFTILDTFSHTLDMLYHKLIRTEGPFFFANNTNQLYVFNSTERHMSKCPYTENMFSCIDVCLRHLPCS